MTDDRNVITTIEHLGEIVAGESIALVGKVGTGRITATLTVSKELLAPGLKVLFIKKRSSQSGASTQLDKELPTEGTPKHKDLTIMYAESMDALADYTRFITESDFDVVVFDELVGLNNGDQLTKLDNLIASLESNNKASIHSVQLPLNADNALESYLAHFTRIFTTNNENGELTISELVREANKELELE